jgi:hypothetical protein
MGTCSTCSTCKHWERYVDGMAGGVEKIWGNCLCPAIACGNPPTRPDCASFWVADRDGEPHLLTGEAFGCVHHAPE